MRHAKADIAAHEHLEVLQKDLFGGLAVQFFTGFEHFGGKLVDVHAGDLGQTLGRRHIHRGADV